MFVHILSILTFDVFGRSQQSAFTQHSREIRFRIPCLFSGPSQLERFMCIPCFSRTQMAIGACADSFWPQRLDLVGKIPNNAPVTNRNREVRRIISKKRKLERSQCFSPKIGSRPKQVLGLEAPPEFSFEIQPSGWQTASNHVHPANSISGG